MSTLIAENPSINFGDTTTVIAENLTNIVWAGSTSIISIEDIPSNNSSIATVIPTQTTIYYVSGTDLATTYPVDLNVTVYVNPIINASSTSVIQGSTTTLSAQGGTEYTWIGLGLTSKTTTNYSGTTITPTLYEPTNFTVYTTDAYNTKLSASIVINISEQLFYYPSELSVYTGNRLFIQVTNPGDFVLHWKPLKTVYINPYPKEVGTSIILHPYQSETYLLEAYDSSGSLQIVEKLNIKVVDKPMNILDIDLLPYEWVQTILQRDKKSLRNLAIKNTGLSKKIIFFYFSVLQTASRTFWKGGSGCSFPMNYLTFYQIQQENNEMIITFTQQWKFFKYIQQNQIRPSPSYFVFLINTLFEIYLEHPQKIYITPILGAVNP